MISNSVRITACIALLLAAHAHIATAATCAPVGAAGQAAPAKKSGGFRALLSAAKRAGVVDMIGGNALGNSAKSQAAGAVIGTVVDASDGSPDPTRVTSALAGRGRTAQAAGAVAGISSELARAEAQAGATRTASTCTPEPPPAPTGAWN